MSANPIEQLPFNLTESENTAAPEKMELENLNTEELEKLYQEKVGKDPKMRFLDKTPEERRAVLIRGISNPEDALHLLRIIDTEDAHAGDVHFEK